MIKSENLTEMYIDQALLHLKDKIYSDIKDYKKDSDNKFDIVPVRDQSMMKLSYELTKKISKVHNEIIITFHHIDDHEFKTNLEIDAIIKINLSGTDYIDAKILKDDKSRYICTINIMELTTGYRLYLPFVRLRDDKYILFNYEVVIVKLKFKEEYEDFINVKITIE